MAEVRLLTYALAVSGLGRAGLPPFSKARAESCLPPSAERLKSSSVPALNQHVGTTRGPPSVFRVSYGAGERSNPWSGSEIQSS